MDDFMNPLNPLSPSPFNPLDPYGLWDDDDVETSTVQPTPSTSINNGDDNTALGIGFVVGFVITTLLVFAFLQLSHKKRY